MKDFEVIKQQICEIGKRLYDKGFVPGKSGNISVQIDDYMLITPSGYNLGDVTPSLIPIINIETGEFEGGKPPSSERNMHLEIYRKRPDLSCIIHAHCPKSTAFAIAGRALNMPVLAEGVLSLGSIPVASYAMPSSQELADFVSEKFLENDVVLMANHGVVIGNKNLLDAYYVVETLEMFAETVLWTKVLGNANELSSSEMQKLKDLKKRLAQ
ncbi:MAG: class II aldolase/adducin family protein [bacterium]